MINFCSKCGAGVESMTQVGRRLHCECGQMYQVAAVFECAPKAQPKSEPCTCGQGCPGGAWCDVR